MNSQVGLDVVNLLPHSIYTFMHCISIEHLYCERVNFLTETKESLVRDIVKSHHTGARTQP